MIPISQEELSPLDPKLVLSLPSNLRNMEDPVPVLFPSQSIPYSQKLKNLLNDSRQPEIRYKKFEKPQFELMSSQQKEQYWQFRVQGGNIYGDDNPYFYFNPNFIPSQNPANQSLQKLQKQDLNNQNQASKPDRKLSNDNSDMYDQAYSLFFRQNMNLVDDLKSNNNAMQSNQDKSINKSSNIYNIKDKQIKISKKLFCVPFRNKDQICRHKNLQGRLGINHIVCEEDGNRIALVCSDNTIKIYRKNPNYNLIDSNQQINQSRVYIQGEQSVMGRDQLYKNISLKQQPVNTIKYNMNNSAVSFANQSQNQTIQNFYFHESKKAGQELEEQKQWLFDSEIVIQHEIMVTKILWKQKALGYGANDGMIRVYKLKNQIQKMQQGQKWEQIYRQDKKIVQDFEFSRKEGSLILLYVTADGYFDIKQLKIERQINQCKQTFYSNFLASYRFPLLISPQTLSENKLDLLQVYQNHLTYFDSVIALGTKSVQASQNYLRKIWRQCQLKQNQDERDHIQAPYLIDDRTIHSLSSKSKKQTQKNTLSFVTITNRRTIHKNISNKKIFAVSSPNPKRSLGMSTSRVSTIQRELDRSIKSEQIIEGDISQLYQWKIKKCEVNLPIQSTVNCVKWAHVMGKSYQMLGVATDQGVKIIQVKIEYPKQSEYVDQSAFTKVTILNIINIQQTTPYRCLKIKWNIYGTFLSVVQEYLCEEGLWQQIRNTKDNKKPSIMKKNMRNKIYYSKRRGKWLEYKVVC